MFQPNPQRSWIADVAGPAMLASGVISGVAVCFFVAMYAAFAVGSTSTGRLLGGINDTLTLVAYLVAVPGVLAVHVILRGSRPVLLAVATAIALLALAAIVLLQLLLVLGVLTFEQQIGPVAVAFLVLGAWFVGVGYVGGRRGLLPNGVAMGVSAALYVGYPFWAYRLGRHLRRGAAPTQPRARSAAADG
jgi:hypothetical protein